MVLSCFFSLTYLLVFSGVVFALKQVDLKSHIDIIQQWLQSGMLVHLVIASLMVFWGVLLLRNNRSRYASSRGWLLLAMPCPVCLVVILFSAGVLLSYDPEHFLRTAFVILSWHLWR